MGNYTILVKFENPRRGRQEISFSENDPKILDLKSSSEQIIFRKLSLGALEKYKSGIRPNFCVFRIMFSHTVENAVHSADFKLEIGKTTHDKDRHHFHV